MVDRVLFYPWLQTEIANVGRVVSKAGWSPLPEGFRLLENTFPERESIAVDKTAWDWTMPGWVVKAYYDCKIAQGKQLTEKYAVAAQNRIREVVGPQCVFRLPDGRRLRQTSWGLMKSGWLLTLSMNSAAQYFQHAVACRRLGWSVMDMWAMGDDLLMRARLSDEQMHEYEQSLSRTGCLVKHALRAREFAGFRFTEGQVLPLYQDKHRFALQYVKPDLEQDLLFSYFLLYSMVDRFGWVESLRDHAKFPVGPRFRSWAVGRFTFNQLASLPYEEGLMRLDQVVQ